MAETSGDAELAKEMADLRRIRDVWAYNLAEEMAHLRDVAEQYPYVAMDTEFPGVVARPTGTFRTPKEYNYQAVKCNVDLLKVIQIGLTFADSGGNRPEGVSTWQFNFRFDLVQDLYAQESIDFLRHCGIDFERHTHEGIDVQDFAELLMSSGVVLNEDVRWISFHGSYDFGYLLKILTCQPLPDEEEPFFDLLHTYFPALYDIKFLLRNVEALRFAWTASLNVIAEQLNVRRVGQAHQAGSDSLVTCLTFFKLVENYFDNQIDDSKYAGVVYGLGALGATRRGELFDGRRSPSPEGSSSEENSHAWNAVRMGASARFGTGGGPHGVEQIGTVHGGALGFAPAGPMHGGPLMAPVPHQPAYLRGASPLG